MYVNVPIGNQRTERGSDGQPPEDGNMDCVAESLAKMAQALTGKSIAGDDLHDAVYGQGYVGMQDPARYVSYLASHYGLTLSAYTGTPAALLQHAVACIRARQPVLLSIPSDWNNNPPHSPYAHMVAACDVDSSAGTDWQQMTLTAMNPWTATYQTQTLAWWQERLAACSYKASWVMTKKEALMAVPSGWHDDGTTLTAPNGIVVVRGFRAEVIAAQPQWPGALVPLAAEHPVPGSADVEQAFALVLHWHAHENTVTVDAGTDATVTPPAPAPAPTPDPVAQAALKAIQGLKSAMGEL
jgi:hypothetical protein